MTAEEENAIHDVIFGREATDDGSSVCSSADRSRSRFQHVSTRTGSTTAGGGAELIAVATRREREIAKHGKLEQIEGKDKECSETSWEAEAILTFKLFQEI